MKGRNDMKGKHSMNDRKIFVDNIRWVTVILVLLYHVLLMYNGVGIEIGCGRITDLKVQYYDSYMYFVYPWFMPILFIVAGMSSRYYLEKHSVKEFIKSRTTKLLVPGTIGLFVFQFIQGYVSMALGDAFDNMLILVLIRKLEKGRLLKVGEKTPIWLIILFCIPVWASGLIMNTPVITVYRISFYLLFYILGYYIFSNEKVIEKLKKLAVPFILAGAVICIAFTVYYFVIKDMANFADAPVNRTFFYAAAAYFGSLAMLAGFAKYFDFSTGFTLWMSKRSFGLYMFHYLGISTVALIFGKTGILPAVPVYIISLVAGFVFGYGLYEIISRIPFFRWAVLGISRKKKVEDSGTCHRE